jgi:hypothetical protein
VQPEFITGGHGNQDLHFIRITILKSPNTLYNFLVTDDYHNTNKRQVMKRQTSLLQYLITFCGVIQFFKPVWLNSAPAAPD